MLKQPASSDFKNPLHAILQELELLADRHFQEYPHFAEKI
jgi:hypothetical protein